MSKNFKKNVRQLRLLYAVKYFTDAISKDMPLDKIKAHFADEYPDLTEDDIADEICRQFPQVQEALANS